MNKIAFDLAIAYASAVFTNELAENKLIFDGFAPESVDKMEHFKDLVEDAYDYYQNCKFDFTD